MVETSAITNELRLDAMTWATIARIIEGEFAGLPMEYRLETFKIYLQLRMMRGLGQEIDTMTQDLLGRFRDLSDHGT